MALGSMFIFDKWDTVFFWIVVFAPTVEAIVIWIINKKIPSVRSFLKRKVQLK